jgi:predicted dehydrogenase
MTDPLRVGIAGYGVVGKRRREFIDQRPDMHTVAVSDKTFKKNDVLDDGIRYFSNYNDLLNEKIDVLFVCMTNDINPEATIKGLKKGVHVFCEKPPGRTVNDIEEVIKVERLNSTLKLKYGFNHRYHDSIQKALEIIENKELGKVINLRGVYGKSQLITFDQTTWRTDRLLAGGGVLLDQGIHLVDLMSMFAGEFDDIHSFISNGHWKHNVEDNAYAIMRTKEGVVAMLHSSATQWRHRFSLEITLEKGALIMSGILSGSKSYGSETLTIIRANADERGDPQEEIFTYDQDNSWANEIDEFSHAILDETPIVHGSSIDALKSMKLVYQIYCADPQWRERWNLNNDGS